MPEVRGTRPFRRILMVFNSTTRACRGLAACMSVLIAVVLISALASAQSDSNPRWDVFGGYQYFHPGITVPAGDPNNPTAFPVPDMPRGFGTALTYNFDPHW